MSALHPRQMKSQVQMAPAVHFLGTRGYIDLETRLHRRHATWCAKEGVPEAIFTHCGAQIVGGDERKLGALIRCLAPERGFAGARIVHDGMAVEFE